MKKTFFLLLCPVFFVRPARAQELQRVVVRPGDTLWSISNVYLKDPTRWNELLKYNKLPSSDPSIALPGMALRVPINMMKEQFRAARLIYYINEVLYRRSGSSDWKGVAAKMELFRSDTLRTTNEARADVKFHTGEVLNLYPNSIAVLRPPDKQADVELVAGEMRGLRSRVVTISARIAPKTKDTEFGAKLKDDLTTLVQVYKGRASVESQGKVVEVPEGFASEIKLDLPPSQPVKLPPLPEFEMAGKDLIAGAGPDLRLKMEGGLISLKNVKTEKGGAQLPQGDRNQVVITGVPKAGDPSDKNIKISDIVKTVSVINPVQSYHVLVSGDQGFSKIALDRRYDVFDSINLNELLPSGIYWVKISYIDLLGFEGKYNEPRQITLGGAAPVSPVEKAPPVRRSR